MCIFITPPGATRNSRDSATHLFHYEAEQQLGEGRWLKESKQESKQAAEETARASKRRKNVLCCARMKETRWLLSAAALGFHNSEWDGVYVTRKNLSLQMKV